MRRQIMQLIMLFTAHIFSLLLLFPGKENVQTEGNCCSPKVTLEVADTPVETTICDEAEPIALAVPPDKETTAPDPIPIAYTISDFPHIWQMPELPTGCEITALTMTLQYYGYEVNKTTMAAEYLPTVYRSR